MSYARAGRGVVITLLVTACAGEHQGELLPSTIDSAGIVIATSSHRPVQDSVGWRLSALPVLEVSTRPDLVIHWIRAAVRLSDGRLAMISESGRHLLFLSSEGELLGTVGREGDGPGEFRAPYFLNRLANDTLVVSERGSARATWFDRNGDFIRQESSPRDRLRGIVPEGFTLSEVRFVARGFYVARAPQQWRSPPPGRRFRPPLGFVMVGPGGPPVYMGGFRNLEHFAEDDSNGRFAFFANGTHLAAGGAPERVFIGDTDPFEVRVFDLTGRLMTIIRDNAPPSPITEQDIEWERWELLDWGEQSDQLEAFLRLADQMPIPERKPAFEALYVDSEGYLWAKEYTSHRPELAWYRIYDRRGIRVGAVRLPGRLQITDIGRDYVLGVEWDLNYVETVQMYALTRPIAEIGGGRPD